MDYKEKVIALLNDQELSKEQKEKLENIFPELQENKDDRIVRCLLNYFNHVRYNGLDLKGTDVDEVISWLEEQGKKSTIIDIDKMVMEYSQTKDDDFGLPVNCMIRAYRKGINDALSITLNIEKQGEKVTDINGEDYGIDGLYHAIDILEKTIGRVGGYQSDDGILAHKAAINAVKELLKDKLCYDTLDADKKVDRVIGTADHIKTALDVLNKKGGEE